MSRILKATILMLVVGCVGCGGGGLEDNPVSVEPVESPVKVLLQGVAETGELGSGAMDIRNALEQMKADGNANADALLADLAEMEAMADPERIKRKAQEMIDSL